MIFFLIWQKAALNQRSGMILEVQTQNFGRTRGRQSFHFQKIPGGLNINIFLWKSAWSFLLHWRSYAQTNFSFKNYLFILTPEKARFWFLNHKKNFFRCWLWFRFKNNRLTNVFLVGIFENSLKKAIRSQKRHFGRF